MKQKITTLYIGGCGSPHDEGSTRFLLPGASAMGLRVQEIIVDIHAIRTQRDRDWLFHGVLTRAAPEATLRWVDGAAV